MAHLANKTICATLAGLFIVSTFLTLLYNHHATYKEEEARKNVDNEEKNGS